MGALQLKARQLDGDHVVRLLGGDGVNQGEADVAGGDSPTPGRGQHRGEHLHRRRLAVRPRQGEPRCR